MKDKKDIQEKIEKLRKEVELHNYNYHILDNPKISDEVFDALFKELVKLENENPGFQNENSPTKRVGGAVLENFKKVKHEVAQWSYEKVFDFDELQKWEERNLRILEKNSEGNFASQNFPLKYFCELKIDGLKVILKYENGNLVQAATRGDGSEGEDVTENIKTIRTIPLKISAKEKIYVIGEVWIAKKDFEKINEERKKENLELYANPRNTAAGTLRQLDTKVVSRRKLKYFAYDIKGVNFETQENVNNKLIEFGFLVNNENRLCKNLNEIQEYFEKWNGNIRNEQEYGVDGLVIKMNDLKIAEELGFTAQAPRSDVAYKFKAEEAVSTILDITFQVGRTGVITPVAELEPVELAGSTVKRATLHNFDEIKRLGVKMGDKVMVRKAGDIIPQVFGVLKNLRTGKEKEIETPTSCPVCNSVLEKDTENAGVKLICKNKKCPEKIKGRIVYFVSRNCMNIDGLGEKIIEQFYNEKLIKNISDLYKLDYDRIAKLEGWKEKSIDNLKKSIENSKNPLLEKFIVSLGINTVGEETAIDLAKNFETFENFWITKSHITYLKEKLSSIYGIGEKTIFEILEFMKDEENQKEIAEILKYVKPQKYKNTNIGNIFLDKRFVITGTFEKYSRDEIEKIIKENGGSVQNAVNAKTTFLIVGEDAGSKLKKAQDLKVKTISIEEFLKMI
jgi:DNA ligase (NAD+)